MVPFQIGSIYLVLSSVKNSAAIGPTKSPIRINGRIAGILNLHATHCANIPRIIIPANSNIPTLLLNSKLQKIVKLKSLLKLFFYVFFFT